MEDNKKRPDNISQTSNNTPQVNPEVNNFHAHTQPRIEESEKQVDNAPKARRRNRPTKAKMREHLELIGEAMKKNHSLLELRHKLGISKDQMNAYIAELALSGHVSFANYEDNVILASNLQNTVMKRLNITDKQNTLLRVEASETGLLISIVPSSIHNI